MKDVSLVGPAGGEAEVREGMMYWKDTREERREEDRQEEREKNMWV